MILSQTGTVLEMTTEVPMYMRGHVAEDNKDALWSAKDDSTFNKEGSTSVAKNQASSANIQLKLLFIIDDKDG